MIIWFQVQLSRPVSDRNPGRVDDRDQVPAHHAVLLQGQGRHQTFLEPERLGRVVRSCQEVESWTTGQFGIIFLQTNKQTNKRSNKLIIKMRFRLKVYQTFYQKNLTNKNEPNLTTKQKTSQK